MRIERFNPAPQQALEVRIKVFVEEQGFCDAFDEIDAIAMHFVAFGEIEEEEGYPHIWMKKSL